MSHIFLSKHKMKHGGGSITILYGAVSLQNGTGALHVMKETLMEQNTKRLKTLKCYLPGNSIWATSSTMTKESDASPYFIHVRI